jgi:hypothetical protein
VVQFNPVQLPFMVFGIVPKAGPAEFVKRPFKFRLEIEQQPSL